ncbi:ABC transporter permease [Leucobacter sp. CSA1]|uniref:ABC transporter permease n=1 Tax=Leucobacter chromiisoli TaxID=2796471 RepID=A0A934Q630_9MICO|nr:ABC transporter permease [Leucobacter chromiisoli]MBK0417721.1 ABC transporter permease [Leucobacter chromiisoli]
MNPPVDREHREHDHLGREHRDRHDHEHLSADASIAVSADSVESGAARRSPSLAAWWRLCVCEAKMTVRDTAGLVIPLGLPIIILLTSASTASTEIVANGRSALDLFVLPLVSVMVVTMIGVLNMPSFLAYYRRSGILRRLATTPLSPLAVLAAQVAVSFVQALLGIALAFGVAAAFFGARPPIHAWTALGVLLLTMLAMYGIGMIVASLAPTPNAAVALGLIGFLGLGALGGMFGSRDALPGWMATVGEALPFGAGVEALSAAWAGMPADPAHLVSLAVSAVVGAAVAALFFRWE